MNAENKNMFWTIIKKEFLSNIFTFRLWTAALLCVVLIPLTVNVSIKNYEERLRNYHVEKERYDKEFKEARAYSFARPTAIKPPQVLSILCTGIENNVGNVFKIKLGEVPFLPEGEMFGKDNPLLGSFSSIDFIFVILIIISLFSILLTYNSINGERERGHLKQILSYPIKRNQIIIAKYFGSLLVIILLLLLSFILATLLMVLSPNIQITLDHLLRLFLLLLISIVYSSVFLLIGLLISSRTQNPPTGLMLCLFIWVVLVLLLPAVSLNIAKEINKIPTLKEMDEEENMLIKEFSNNFYKNFSFRNDAPCMNGHYGPDGGMMSIKGSKEFYEVMLKQAITWKNFFETAAGKVKDVKKKYIDILLKQRELALWFTFLTPAYLFQNASESLMNVSGSDFENFIFQAKLYRDQFIKFLNNKIEKHPFKYVSPEDESSLMNSNEWINYFTNGRFKTYNEYKEYKEVEKSGKNVPLFDKTKIDLAKPEFFPPVDVSEMPDFKYQIKPISFNLFDMLFQILILLIMNIVLFYLTFIFFYRYDVR
jgi:ABC-type transport system involved in multi-copper enzyme maturation permease subunit